MLPASERIRLAGERDTDTLAEEHDRAAQRRQMEGTVNERARAEITRSSQALEDDNDRELKRQRLGEPLATIPEETVGDEASDIEMDDPARLIHEEARKEGRLDGKPQEISKS